MGTLWSLLGSSSFGAINEETEYFIAHYCCWTHSLQHAPSSPCFWYHVYVHRYRVYLQVYWKKICGPFVSDGPKTYYEAICQGAFVENTTAFCWELHLHLFSSHPRTAQNANKYWMRESMSCWCTSAGVIVHCSSNTAGCSSANGFCCPNIFYTLSNCRVHHASNSTLLRSKYMIK